MASSLR
nr:unnamed protein product [Mus musculus]